MHTALPDYNSPAALAALLDGHGLGMQKKFGQNFLINGRIRTQLVDSLNLAAGDTVWEVGPGLGAVTALLLETGAEVTAFEIDRGFIGLLKTFFAPYPNFRLIEGDVLKTWKAEYARQKPAAFFGNLPYNIAAKLIASCIEAQCFFDRMAVTVQKEVGLRMSTAPRTADYSSFSVLCQWCYDIKTIRDIAPAAFWPKPNVESRAVLLQKKAAPQPVKDIPLFLQLVRALFASRRKTLKNNLNAWLASAGKKTLQAEDLLKAADISPSARAETLAIYDFIRIADILAAQV